MTDVRAATESLLQDKPALEDSLEALLAVDADRETWTFEDVPVDSGTFGELVSRGIVEKTDDEYRLRDPTAVETALDPNATVDDETGSESSLAALGDWTFSLPDVDRVAALGLAGALALVILFRLLPYPSVFQHGDVVLSGNDPYAYRYLVHQLLAESGGALDLATLSELPGGIAHGEPLLVATLWWVSAVFGGAVDQVLAWYPVVSAVVTALLVYVLVVRVMADRRAAIAAVALLAIMPGHAFRTGLGFADHHAFDYPWLALTALAVVSLAGRDLRNRRTWAWALALGVGVSGQTLAWDAGPLLLVPFAAYVALVVPSWVRVGRSPFREGAGLIAGLALGAAIVAGAHHEFGWHSTEVAAVPGLLLAGTIGVFALGALTRQFDIGVRPLLVVEASSLIAGILAVRTLLPSLSEQLSGGVDFLLTTEGIAETTSIVSGRVGSLVGPVFLFGFALFLAVPYLAWASWRCAHRHEPGLLAVSMYAWVFLALGIVQARFAGQLAIFVAVFGGLGFVHLAAWVDLTPYPELFAEGERERPGESDRRDAADTGESDGLDWPERREALYTAGLGLGVGSLGIAMTPIKHSQVTIDDSMYDAAAFMREYADEQGWAYPDNYVLSRWGRSRVYNWFVNGESRSYGYAQSNYENFVTSTDGTEWYERLRDRVGFIVTGRGLPIDAGGRTIYERLWSENLGIETDHYRAVWAADDDSRRAYTLVPGALIAGQTESIDEVTIQTELSLNGTTRPCETTATTTSNGWYATRVPSPGTYTAGTDTITVTESDVTNGRFAVEREGTAYWHLDEGEGEYAFDSLGNNHGYIVNGSWTEGVDGHAFQATGEGYIRVPNHDVLSARGGFTISAWVRTNPEVDYREEKKFPRVLAKAKSSKYKNTDGFILTLSKGRISAFLGDGDVSTGIGGGRIDDAEWHQIALTYDGSQAQLLLDGDPIDEAPVEATVANEQPFVIGAASDGSNTFVGRIDDVRFWNTAVDLDSIRD